MARDRIAVNEHATPDDNEVLVTFRTGKSGSGDTLQNHLLRSHPDLFAKLASTPREIPNPAHDATKPADEDNAATIPNPARATVEGEAFAAAEKELDDAAKAATKAKASIPTRAP
jgi:hypothetical protein